MIIETLSTFPSMYDSVMGASMMRIAQEKGILTFKAHDLRDWTHDRHRTTDDDPYGGGDGLVMKCEPIFEAYEDIAGNLPADAAGDPSTTRPAAAPLGMTTGPTPQVEPLTKENSCRSSRADSRQDAPEQVSPPRHEDFNEVRGTGDGGALREIPHEPNSPVGCSSEPRTARAESPSVPGPVKRPHTIFLAPHGEPFDDALACELAREERLLFVCGHYEGIDERAYALADRTISLGDYVLTSGELASMVVIDAVVRKLPGVLGAPTGALGESFADGLLEYPQYTRPATYRGMDVPAVLLSGDHGAVARWRRERSLERTARLRPDLLDDADLSRADREFLLNLSQ
ncbi:tRNA (guanine(37)-N(1))-methyltransferase [Gordonibacter sp. 28C]|uniref:tRNA (guanine(37)-N(1))-methyltransferase n=1 Tax=Gordonibacter sp. 28C TaxID=2078569 RepID=UPI001F541E93|nr:tRNA (guanosine(37)-N1)-methyltransferase TrmD [Gordonibacter sp. 28C]